MTFPRLRAMWLMLRGRMVQPDPTVPPVDRPGDVHSRKVEQAKAEREWVWAQKMLARGGVPHSRRVPHRRHRQRRGQDRGGRDMTDLPGGELFDRYGLKRCRGCGRWRNPSSCCIPCVTRLARRMVERENTPRHEQEGGRMSWCPICAVKAKREESAYAERKARRDREAALAAATEALVKAALAWASPQSATELAPLATHLKDAVAAYRKAKGEG